MNEHLELQLRSARRTLDEAMSSGADKTPKIYRRGNPAARRHDPGWRRRRGEYERQKQLNATTITTTINNNSGSSTNVDHLGRITIAGAM